MIQHARTGRAALAAAALGALCLAATSGRAAPAPQFELEYVPPDAAAVLSVRVGALLAHPVVKAARDRIGKDLPLPLQEAEKRCGVALADVDRFTVVEMAAAKPASDSVAVATAKPYDRKAILAAVAPDAKEEKAGDRVLYRNEHGPSVVFLDERTFAVGPADALQGYLNRPGVHKAGALTAALKEGETHAAFLAVDAAAFARAWPPPKDADPDVTPLLPLWQAQTALLTADLDDALRADARLTFADEEDAGAGAGAAQAGLDLVRERFAAALKEPGKDPDAGKLVGVLTDMADALKSVRAERAGATVKASVKVEIDAARVVPALADASRLLDKAMRRARLVNAMMRLTNGSITYADAHNGAMLPAAVLDKNGKPLLSWRVLILPYIGEEALYKEFRLDEPWDGEHNKKLLERMPAVFAPSDSDAFKKHETYYQALVGKDTVFDGTPLRFPASIPDGTSQTIMYVEAAKSVLWTKPEDVPFDGGPLLPKLGGLTKTGFLVGMCDGSAYFFPLSMKEDNLHAWVTRSGGEVCEDPNK